MRLSHRLEAMRKWSCAASDVPCMSTSSHTLLV